MASHPSFPEERGLAEFNLTTLDSKDSYFPKNLAFLFSRKAVTPSL